MNNFEDSWWSHFVPECYFDTVLFKMIFKTDKRLKHTKGCNNVVNRFRIINGKKGDLYDSFGVGMIDKDKKELHYLKECVDIINLPNLILWKNKQKNHFVIQLNPPLEKWVIEILNEGGLKIEDFGYSSDEKKFKKQIKDDIDKEEDRKLNKLVDAIVKTDCVTIKKLKSILHILKDKNYQVDINELKNV